MTQLLKSSKRSKKSNVQNFAKFRIFSGKYSFISSFYLFSIIDQTSFEDLCIILHWIRSALRDSSFLYKILRKRDIYILHNKVLANIIPLFAFPVSGPTVQVILVTQQAFVHERKCTRAKGSLYVLIVLFKTKFKHKVESLENLEANSESEVSIIRL